MPDVIAERKKVVKRKARPRDAETEKSCKDDGVSEISKCLKRALEERGMSQTELAEKIGASTGAVSRWLSGERTPAGEYLVKIQKALSLPANWADERPTLTLVPPLPSDDSGLRPNQIAALRAWDWSGVSPDAYKRAVEDLRKAERAMGGDAVPEYWTAIIRSALKPKKPSGERR